VTGIVSVYAVFADEEEAARIGRAMVEEKLAACVNILRSCRSIYRWQGRIEDAQEVAAVFKTAEETASVLIGRIGDLHSYEVPAAVAWPIIEVADAYRDWVMENSESDAPPSPSSRR